MSKEVQVISWCDGDHDVQEAAVTERTVSVDGGRPILLDLCEPCDKVFADLAELMSRGVFVDTKRKPPTKPKAEPVEGKVSQRANTPPPEERVVRKDVPPEERLDCLEPKCIDRRTGKRYVGSTRSALGQHVKTKHNKVLSDYEWSD